MIQARRAAPLALALLMWATVVPAQSSGDGARELPPDVKQTVQGIAQSLMQVQDTDVELSCDKAVENARYGLETMLEVGQKNTDDGYMKRSDFEPMAAKLRESLAQITPQDCAGATGPKQAFYRCMSSDYNHVTACAATHRF